MSDLDTKAEALLADLKPTSPSAAPGQNFLPPHTRRDVPGQYGSTPIWRAGEGPAALFVHGWDDTHRIWRHFAQDFLQNTRPVLLMDLPSHGASKVEYCTPETASVRAIAAGAHADYLVLIAPPLLDWADYQHLKGHDDETITRARELLAERGGEIMSRVDFREALADYKGAILLVGSQADKSSPLPLIRELANGLASAKLVEDDTLSHRDIALDPRILSEITTFLGY